MSSLQDRLYNQEQTPPSQVWDRIAAALDDSDLTHSYPSRLYNAEVQPPSEMWNKIAEALEPAPVVTNRRTFSFYRYAAAAILIGVIVLAAAKWLNRHDDASTDDLAQNTKSAVPTVREVAPKQTDSVAINSQTPESSEQPIASIDDENMPRRTPARKIAHVSPINDNTDVTDLAPLYASNSTNIADRYIMYMTPDGGIVRMSKKWGNLVCCVSGQEQDPDCIDQLKKWQEKVACAPVANGNFMDILSLVNTLNTDL